MSNMEDSTFVHINSAELRELYRELVKRLNVEKHQILSKVKEIKMEILLKSLDSKIQLIDQQTAIDSINELNRQVQEKISAVEIIDGRLSEINSNINF
ncbi:MAG: hypothetical protein HGA49_11445 [Eubacteriaceae bacterium]|nr:hypothetical protein [Eubacteriaceae bacterium]